MEYKGNIFTKEGILRKGIIKTENNIITDIVYDDSISDDRILVPGLIDMHLHGAVGFDICDASLEAIEKIAAYERDNGIFAFLGATMTIAEEEIQKVLSLSEECSIDGFQGIYLEGPFISDKYCGAQKCEYIKKLNKEKIPSNKSIKVVVVAPEEVEDVKILSNLKEKGYMISLGHTAADYKQAMEAFSNGADQVTHLYNAMADMTKRSPGIPGAAFDAGAYIELIADGNHISDTMIRMTFNAYDDNKIILISDSMRGTGLKDGKYTLGGQAVLVESRENQEFQRVTRSARLSDGTLAGSVTNLHDCLINVINAGVAFDRAIKAATINPARRLGIDNMYGTIELGKYKPIYL